jgi:hypothetical protein
MLSTVLHGAQIHLGIAPLHQRILELKVEIEFSRAIADERAVHYAHFHF